MRRNPVKKGNLTYGESYDLNKKRREEEAHKREVELHKSYSTADEGFDASLGAMMGALMANDEPDDEPIIETIRLPDSQCQSAEVGGTWDNCDTSSSCDISSSFD